MPTNKADAVAMIHDIEYLIATNNKNLLARADKHAVEQASGFHPDVLALKAALTLRSQMNLPMQVATTPESILATQRAGLELKKAVLADLQFKQMMELYNLKFQNDYSMLEDLYDPYKLGKKR